LDHNCEYILKLSLPRKKTAIRATRVLRSYCWFGRNIKNEENYNLNVTTLTSVMHKEPSSSLVPQSNLSVRLRLHPQMLAKNIKLTTQSKCIPGVKS
jgi:hypothetical protein